MHPDRLYVCLFGTYPVRQDIGRRTPLELVNAGTGQTAFIQQPHAWRFKNGNQTLTHPCQVLVVVTPLKGWRLRRWLVVLSLALVPFVVVLQESVGVQRKGAQQLSGGNVKNLDGCNVIPSVVVR